MLANILHISLNARGGSERLAISTMQSLSDMGFSMDLTTCEVPDQYYIKRAYGMKMVKIQKLRTLNMCVSTDGQDIQKYDLVINTHGDMLPYYRKTFNKINSITYCHYPLAKYFIDCKSPFYFRLLGSMRLSSIPSYMTSRYLESIRYSYENMIKKTTVLTNSEYSRSAIWKTFGIDCTVLSPPVDVDKFRNSVLKRKKVAKEDSILVLARFNPSKKIENALELARLLKLNKIGTKMRIVGNLSTDGLKYYSYLKKIVYEFGLADYVEFMVNVKFSKLLELMKISKAYFHPLPGEPFGISTVEAMSAGLIPVVPDIGGHTEFVPKKYQFHTYGQAVEALASALEAPYSEQEQISDSVMKYSISNYIQRFQKVVHDIQAYGERHIENAPAPPAPLLSIREKSNHTM